MAGMDVNSLDTPDETRSFVAKGKLDLVKLCGLTVGRGVFEPGWTWSVHIMLLAGTISCQSGHT